ncbi:MAG: hypothetical protein QOC93_792 [Actinomycetota bacterium]|jgi:hypothetical protein|nr:hypothetical protein [Cryptosporangiaceae bacterium]MDQ1675648.1 hypothetical protein [Actinomycetota bacterium]
MRAGMRAVVAAALVFGLAACGSDGVEPEKWARSVCVAVKPWSTQIDASVTQARTKITAGSDPAQTKTELVALFRGAKRASDDAVAKVKKAGVPAADNGAKVSDQFVGALSAAGDNFGRAADGVEKLSTADRTAFYNGVVKVGDQLSKDNNKSSTALSTVRSKDLEQAFDQVSECR